MNLFGSKKKGGWHVLEMFRTDKHIAIFELVNPITKYCYIDFSLNATLEIDKMIQDLRQGSCTYKRLQEDWNKYNYQSFVGRIIKCYDDEKIDNEYPSDDKLIKMLYDKTLEYKAHKKQLGYKLYNENDHLDYDKMTRKYFSYTRDGRRVIKPYKQKVIFDEGTQWAVLMTKDKDFPPHSHEEIELIYVIDSTIDITINNQIYNLKPRDILFVSSQDIHSFNTPDGECNRLVLLFKIPDIGDTLELFTRKMPQIPLISYDEKRTKEKNIHALLEKEIMNIIDEYKYKRSLYTIAITSRIYNVLKIMTRNMEFVSKSSAYTKQFYKEVQAIRKVFDYISQKYHEPITLQEVADRSNYSIYHFTRIFKKITGMTFNDYLTYYRVQKSIELLLETDKPITEIVYLSGFNSIQTYNRVFKELKQMSPREFRKSNI